MISSVMVLPALFAWVLMILKPHVHLSLSTDAHVLLLGMNMVLIWALARPLHRRARFAPRLAALAFATFVVHHLAPTTQVRALLDGLFMTGLILGWSVLIAAHLHHLGTRGAPHPQVTVQASGTDELCEAGRPVGRPVRHEPRRRPCISRARLRV